MFWSWPQRVIMVYVPDSWTLWSPRSEVDLNGSLWYIKTKTNKYKYDVLKLTSTGHYGIPVSFAAFSGIGFWSWPQRVIMVYDSIQVYENHELGYCCFFINWKYGGKKGYQKRMNLGKGLGGGGASFSPKRMICWFQTAFSIGKRRISPSGTCRATRRM